MTFLSRLLLTLSLAFLGFVVGGRIGASQVPGGAGLAGGATVFLWAVGGAVLSLATGIVLAIRLPLRALRIAALVSVALAVPALLWFLARIAQNR